jgi:hypothetical protein
MSLNNPRPGFNSAPEYMVSGIPHVLSGSATTTPTLVEFPYVTRAITIANNSAAGTVLEIGFTLNGVNLSNRFPLDGKANVRFEVRVRDLWLRAESSPVNYGVLAELTPIERMYMLPLTGSVNTSTTAGQLAATGSIVFPGVG